MISIPGKIPIRIHPFFWILILLIGWFNSNSVLGTAVWAVIIIVSVLIHEFGHALTAIAFGQTASIELVALGGVTQRQGPRLKLWQDFIVVLNGPFAGFLLFLGAFYLVKIVDKAAHPLLFDTLLITTYANLFWTIVNLLPVYPLDGGRLLSIILESVFGNRGVRYGFMLSAIIAIVIGVAFFMYNALLAGSIFLLLAFESYRAWKESEIMTQGDNESLQQMMKEAEEDLREGHKDIAQQKLEQIRAFTNKGLIYASATEYLANLLVNQGKLHEAYEILLPIKDSLSSLGLRMLHQLAYRIGEWRTAILLGDRTYQEYPTYETALTNAFSYALLGEVRPSIGWVQRAIQDGLPNPRSVFHREEFDTIRDTPDFRNLESRYQ